MASRCFYIKEANLPAAGTYNCVVTSGTNNSYMTGNVVSYFNVDQTTPLSGNVYATGSDSAPQATITSAAGDLGVNAVCWRTTSSVHSVNGGETQRFNDNEASVTIPSIAYSEEAGATSLQLLWSNTSSTPWKLNANSLKAAAITRRRGHVS